MLSNLVYMVLCVCFLLYGVLFSSGSVSRILWHFRIPQLLILWWVPNIGSLIYILVLPSISQIVPEKLYLGNAASALTPRSLKSPTFWSYTIAVGRMTRRRSKPI